MLPHIEHLTNLLIQRQRSVEHYCGKQPTNGLRLSIFM